ncbi:Phospholipid phosphatase- protein type 4 [Bulinus truncatus]|nr:Phospholipid phosphatase- protein type 4 [Bulinus truncatus]
MAKQENMYITEYTCTNKLADGKLLNDVRLSFPSGHASIALYSAMYTMLYLELRMQSTSTYFLRPAMQFACLLLGILCGVFRVTDNKHYASDVVAGYLIGGGIAGFLFFKIGWKVIPIPFIDGNSVNSLNLSVETNPTVSGVNDKVKMGRDSGMASILNTDL